MLNIYNTFPQLEKNCLFLALSNSKELRLATAFKYLSNKNLTLCCQKRAGLIIPLAPAQGPLQYLWQP